MPSHGLPVSLSTPRDVASLDHLRLSFIFSSSPREPPFFVAAVQQEFKNYAGLLASVLQCSHPPWISPLKGNSGDNSGDFQRNSACVGLVIVALSYFCCVLKISPHFRFFFFEKHKRNNRSTLFS